MRTSVKVVTGLFVAIQAGNAYADVIDFHFTGRLTVFQTPGSGTPLETDLDYFYPILGSDQTFDPYGLQTPIGANLTVDTDAGAGFSNLSFDFSFAGSPVSIHDITLDFQPNGMIGGHMLADWNGTYDNEVTILWDGSGLFNAINAGLQAGDRISGTNLYRDADGDGYAEQWIQDVGSATPWSDAWYGGNWGINYSPSQGPAPIATALGTFGIIGGPLGQYGIQVHLDIGSGNSLYVDSVQSAVVPVPAAVWLFGSGLMGLIGVARRSRC